MEMEMEMYGIGWLRKSTPEESGRMILKRVAPSLRTVQSTCELIVIASIL
jgi:hypothetical protein